MIIEDIRNTTTHRFYELKIGDVFFFGIEYGNKIEYAEYGVCMKINDEDYYNFETNEVLNTTDNEVVFPVKAKLVLY